jgi:hypothetical protein
MSAPPKAIPDMSFMPVSFAATRGGKIETLYPSEYAILCLLQKGPASTQEVLEASGLKDRRALSDAVHSLRPKLKRLGIVIPSAVNRGYYALARARR